MKDNGEETQFWSIGDELEPDASGQIGQSALQPDPGVDRQSAAGGRDSESPSRTPSAGDADADADATRVVRPSQGAARTSVGRDGDDWLDRAPPEPFDERPRRAPRVRTKQRAVWPRILAPVAFLAAVIALFSIVVDSGLLSNEGQSPAKGTRPAATARAKPKAKFYVVKPGDTVSEIASKHDTTIDALLELNPKMSSTTVNPGEKIRLPQD